MTANSPSQLASPAKPGAPPRYKLLILASHVVPYGSSGFRLLAQDPRLDILVAYCSMQGAERGLDPEFEREIQWDEPLLEGFAWTHVPNKSLHPGLARFFGLWNPGLWRMIRNGGFDAILIYTGYMYASFWLSVMAAKSKRVPILISSDSTTTQPRDGSRWKKWIKPFILGRVYRTIDVLMAGSPAVEELAIKLGMPKERIVIIPSPGPSPPSLRTSSPPGNIWRVSMSTLRPCSMTASLAPSIPLQDLLVQLLIGLGLETFSPALGPPSTHGSAPICC